MKMQETVHFSFVDHPGAVRGASRQSRTVTTKMYADLAVICTFGCVYHGKSLYAAVRKRPLRSPVRRIFSSALDGWDDRKLRLNPAPATKSIRNEIKSPPYLEGFWRLNGWKTKHARTLHTTNRR
jgi:hypothetical protein